MVEGEEGCHVRAKNMDFLTQQFIAVAKKLKEQLNEAKALFSSLDKSIQKYDLAIDKAADAANKTIDPTPEMRAILNTLEAIKTEQRASDTSNSRYQCRNLIAAWAGVFVVAAYTTVTFLILRETNKSADAARDAAVAAKSAADTTSQQFKLTRQQVVSTMGAIVSFNNVEINRRDYTEATLTFANRGHVVSANADVGFEILHSTLDELKQL